MSDPGNILRIILFALGLLGAFLPLPLVGVGLSNKPSKSLLRILLRK